MTGLIKYFSKFDEVSSGQQLPMGATASDEDLARLRDKTNIESIPDSVEQLYRWHDGGVLDAVFGRGFWFLCSISEGIELLDIWRSYSLHIEFKNSDQSDSVIISQLPKSFFPIFNYNASVYGVVNLGVGNAPVYGFDVEDGKLEIWDDSFESFLDTIFQCLRKGKPVEVSDLNKALY